MTDRDMYDLAGLIREEIRSDFEGKHLSRNLMDTIRVTKTEGGFDVEIPAEIYSMYEYQVHGAIVFTGEGSYAERLNAEGSAFWSYRKDGSRRWVAPGNHVNYADEAVRRAVYRWIGKKGFDAEVTFQ